METNKRSANLGKRGGLGAHDRPDVLKNLPYPEFFVPKGYWGCAPVRTDQGCPVGPDDAGSGIENQETQKGKNP